MSQIVCLVPTVVQKVRPLFGGSQVLSSEVGQIEMTPDEPGDQIPQGPITMTIVVRGSQQ